MINLNVPDFDLGFPIYRMLHELRSAHPEIVYDDTHLAAIFGCFGNAIWNGGGIILGTCATRRDVRACIDFYNNEMHVPLRFTFTNPLIGERQCWDSYCNMIAEEGHNGKNEILTASPILEEYLRKNYPHYKFCHSIIATKDEPFTSDPKYDLVVMQRKMNNNWEYLETIPMEQRGKIEFLCCDPCPDDCPRIYSHYRDFARGQLEFDPESPNMSCSMQNLKGDFGYEYMTHLKTFISRDMIVKNYIPRGFNQFKLSGRTNVNAIITDLLDYYIKPEYNRDMMGYLYNSLK